MVLHGEPVGVGHTSLAPGAYTLTCSETGVGLAGKGGTDTVHGGHRVSTGQRALTGPEVADANYRSVVGFP